MIYWVTQTIESSFLPYYDMANAGALRWTTEAVKTWLGSMRVPAGFALFPKDLVTPPREWTQRFFNVQRWTGMPRGGHFAAMEEPELFVEDIGSMFAPLGAEPRRKSQQLVNAWNSPTIHPLWYRIEFVLPKPGYRPESRFCQKSRGFSAG